MYIHSYENVSIISLKNESELAVDFKFVAHTPIHGSIFQPVVFRFRTWKRFPSRGRFKSCPGEGRSHRSISFVAISRQTLPLSKYSGAIKAITSWNSSTNGNRVNKTKDFVENYNN